MTLERSPLLFEAEPARRLPRQPDPERGRAAAGAARAVAPKIVKRKPDISGDETGATPSGIMGRPRSSIRNRRDAEQSRGRPFRKLSPEQAHDELDRVVAQRHKTDPVERRKVRQGPAKTVQAVMGPSGEKITVGTETLDMSDRAKHDRFVKKNLARGKEAAAQHRGGVGDEPWLEKRRLPHDHPALKHSDPEVRQRAQKIKAQAMANSIGGSYDQSEKRGGRLSRAPATVRVLRHKKTGDIKYTTTFHGREHAPVPDDHEVVHTAISESFARQPLLIENVTMRYASDERVKRAFEPSARKTTVSDENLRARLANATGAHAARLKSLLKQREMLKRGVSRKDTPESGARTITTDAQRAARDTVQRRYRGARTQEMRPVGHKTQVLSSPPGSATQPVEVPEVQPLGKRKRGPEKTRVLPKVKVRTASVDVLGSLLQEFAVTTSSAWKSGIAPDETIAGGKAVRGAQTTANIGHTTQQGAAVPDKKKRETKIPKSKLPQGVRDPVTKELEKQPAFPAGPMLSRSGLLGV